MRRVCSRAWLAGTGRSGTTWLGQVLAAPRKTALLYEPFHSWFAAPPPDLWPRFLDAGDRFYFRPDADVPSWNAYVTHVLSGRGFTRRTTLAGWGWQRKPQALWRARTGRHLVVKSIRSNLLLGWFVRNFDVPVVLLIRHPVATVASQKRRAWGAKRNVVDGFLGQRRLVEDHLQGDLQHLASAVLDTNVKRLAARWAIETRVALRAAAGESRILPVAYEALVERPEVELERIFAFLGRDLGPADRRRVRARARPSPDGRLSASERLGRWTSHLTSSERDDVLTVVRSLGVDLYDDGLVPARPAETWVQG